jgi:hypothetical protein
MSSRHEQNNRRNRSVYRSFNGVRKSTVDDREEAQDLTLEYIEPYYPGRLRNRIILAIMLLAMVIVAVSVGIAIPTRGDGKSSLPERSTTSPTAPPSGSSIVDQFLGGLPFYSVLQAKSNASSSQAKALAWLQTDPHFSTFELYRLHQRYALAVFYYSTNGEAWFNSTGWLSNTSECTWYMDTDTFQNVTEDVCEEASHLSLFSLRYNGLAGSIPKELELLTNLQKFRVQGDDSELSVSIYSEL